MALKNYPTGTVVSFAATHPDSLPGGWLLCDGREVSRGTYGNLFSVIDETYGAGDGSTTFNIPDLQEWFVKSVDVATMTSGAGTTVGATTSFQGAQYSYSFGITVSDSDYQDTPGGTTVSSTIGPFSDTSTSAGDHSHSYQISVETIPWGRGVREGYDNMIPPNEYAAQNRIYWLNFGVISEDWFLYHHSGGQAGSWQQHELHSWSHSSGAGQWTHNCEELEGVSQGACTRGVPICTTQQIFIGQSNSTMGKVPYAATLDANHTHLIGPEYQVQEGKKVINDGEFSYQANYSSKRLFSTRGAHNHGGVSVSEQSGITHGQAAHGFTDNITAFFGVATGYPGEGTSNSSGDLKPAAVVVGYLIKT
jgi:microcystin-dependent protein